ncbi:MAG TPA: serine/threonine-protein kinase [Verrucomicrobiae bacterium]|jgi:serine/threonine protein kinase/sugar lactone lactonase YvrE
MSKESSKEETESFIPPVSVFAGPIAELVGHRLLSPPNRPGLLATLARYEVLRVLGGGGMGVVLLARDSESGRDVALKLVRPELAPNQQVVHRFVKEAGHLQKLKHPHIVPVLEISDRPQGPYFVMPYFEKGSLAQRIRPGQGLAGAEALDIAQQVAEGLQFAHQRGIIHRDLKPANILLGAGGQTCLADFGLARTMFNDTIVDVERDQMEGTAPYMSPGVAAGNAEDTRCDIYAFGALLYEMLTGEPPYAGRNTQDIRQQILAGPPRPIRQRNPEADPGLAAVAEGAMARELRNRYADMSDVLADLGRIKQGRAPAGPHGLASRVRHIPGTVWLPAGVVLVFLCWLIWHPVAPPKTAANSPITNTPAPPVLIKQPVVSNPPPDVMTPIPAPKPKPPVVAPLFTPPIIVGSAGLAGSSDGLAGQARFSSPGAIAAGGGGYIYLADMGNDTIRKISPAGDVTTLAGLAGHAGKIDGDGAGARFTAPSGIAVAKSGNVYVAEFANDTIRKITPSGSVSLLAGSPGNPGWKDATGDNAHFRNPWSVAVDASENVYVADKDNSVVRKITPDGAVTTIAGKPGVAGFTDGRGAAARFQDPQGLAVDSSGNIYVADTGNQAVREISPSGNVTSIALGLFRPVSVAVDAKGTVYAADSRGVNKIASGKVETLPPVLLGASPGGPMAQAGNIAVDSHGVIYIVDEGKDVVCWQPQR